MNNFNKLTDYIPYFENAVIYKRDIRGIPDYDDKFNAFIQDVYQSDLLKGDYLLYLDENQNNQEIQEMIPHADLEMLRAILTFIIRAERFCDGSWIKSIEEKEFLNILYRLRELDT